MLEATLFSPVLSPEEQGSWVGSCCTMRPPGCIDPARENDSTGIDTRVGRNVEFMPTILPCQGVGQRKPAIILVPLLSSVTWAGRPCCLTACLKKRRAAVWLRGVVISKSMAWPSLSTAR